MIRTLLLSGLLAGCNGFLPTEAPFPEIPDTSPPVVDATGDTSPPDTAEEVPHTGDTAPPPPDFPPSSVHVGEPPWGINMDIVEVRGGTGPGGNLQVGDRPTIIFRVYDDFGVGYIPRDLADLRIGLTGPSDHMTRLINPDRPAEFLADVVAYNLRDGTDLAWKYSFPNPIPARYAPPPNDTPDIRVDVGDWGGCDAGEAAEDCGEPVVDGTYMLGVWGHAEYPQEIGPPILDGGSQTEWVLFGAATELAVRERVLTENCVICHSDHDHLAWHGGTRTGQVEMCLMCHIQGSEDAWSVEDGTTTPGRHLFMPRMIHKIHRGAGLIEEYRVNGYPASPVLPGFPNYNEHDFSHAVYPMKPEGVASCSCHDNAEEGDEIQAFASRNSCGACHDDIVWSTGENHGLGGSQYDDKTCTNTGCHPPTETQLAHRDDRLEGNLYSPGLHLEVIDITGGSAPGGQFLPGDTLVVEFKATRDDGTAMTRIAGPSPSPTDDDLQRTTIRIAGPLEHMQVVYDSSMTDLSVAGQAVFQATPETWIFTVPVPLPTFFPPQYNDTPDIGFDEGDWGGRPMVPGTYRVVVTGNLEVPDRNGENVRVPAFAFDDVLFGDTVNKKTTRRIVSDEKCNVCHRNNWAHGDLRSGVDNCITCHTAGSEDRWSDIDPLTTPGVSVQFGVMMHQIHAGSDLRRPILYNGYPANPTDPFFPDYNQHEFTYVKYPRLDGGASACDSCHEGGHDTSSGVICMSCHESAGTEAHVALNTDPVLGESCDVCHAPGSLVSNFEVHDTE